MGTSAKQLASPHHKLAQSIVQFALDHTFSPEAGFDKGMGNLLEKALSNLSAPVFDRFLLDLENEVIARVGTRSAPVLLADIQCELEFRAEHAFSQEGETQDNFFAVPVTVISRSPAWNITLSPEQCLQIGESLRRRGVLAPASSIQIVPRLIHPDRLGALSSQILYQIVRDPARALALLKLQPGSPMASEEFGSLGMLIGVVRTAGCAADSEDEVAPPFVLWNNLSKLPDDDADMHARFEREASACTRALQADFSDILGLDTGVDARDVRDAGWARHCADKSLRWLDAQSQLVKLRNSLGGERVSGEQLRRALLSFHDVQRIIQQRAEANLGGGALHTNVKEISANKRTGVITAPIYHGAKKLADLHWPLVTFEDLPDSGATFALFLSGYLGARHADYAATGS